MKLSTIATISVLALSLSACNHKNNTTSEENIAAGAVANPVSNVAASDVSDPIFTPRDPIIKIKPLNRVHESCDKIARELALNTAKVIFDLENYAQKNLKVNTIDITVYDKADMDFPDLNQYTMWKIEGDFALYHSTDKKDMKGIIIATLPTDVAKYECQMPKQK